jgi:collagenase-like PrtC family protease
MLPLPQVPMPFYLGGKQFNARAYATNFSEKEILAGIRLLIAMVYEFI